MPRKNLELKAKCHSLASLRQQVTALKAEYRQTMQHVDTYFNVPQGRLKLRELAGFEACLIYYERPDAAESRYSNYQLYDISDPATFKQMMTAALGVKVVVTKRRELWMYGETRIHLDEVEDLGEFVELETVFTGQTEAEAHAEHQRIKDALEIRADDLIDTSYSDLLLSSR